MTYIKKYILSLAIFSASALAFGQEKETKESVITGVVIESATKKPVAGAAVSIPGISSSITDDEGRFNLSKTVDGAFIQVQIPGYATQTVAVKGRKEITVFLYDDTFRELNRTVNTPFGTADLWQSTASVSPVSLKNSYKKGSVGVESILQDEGAGLNSLTRSGAPGAGGNLFLRGFTSLNATNQPLIIIDGIPYENSSIGTSLVDGNMTTPLSGLDLKDIENITVLKDNTSIYGSRGANGVVLITTAKAKTQATSIDFYAHTGINLTPKTQYRMLNGWESKAYLSEMLSSSGLYTASEIQALPFINQEKPVVENWGISGNADYYRYNHNTDWQGKVFESSMTNNLGISVKGGDDVALYALSVGYTGQDGIVKNSTYSRYNTQFNTQVNMSANIKLNANMNFSYAEKDLMNERLNRDLNPIYASLIKSPFMAANVYDETGAQSPKFEQADIFGVTNPSALVDEQTFQKSKNYRFLGNLEGIFKLNKDFSINAIFGLTFDKVRENIFLPSNGLHHQMLPTAEVRNEMQSMVGRYLQYYGDLRFNYSRKFNVDHDLTARAGVRYQTNNSEFDQVKAYNSANDNLQTIGQGDIDLTQKSGSEDNWKWLSYYLNADYGYKNKYLVSFNMAIDGSSRIGKEASGLKMFDNVFGVFPSLSAAWLISSEDFMAGVDKISFLKFRLGYTRTGNSDIGNYTARSYYNSQNFLGYYGFVRGNIANPELKWENNTKLNAGLDVGLFNDRLSVSADVYTSKTTDMLMWEQLQGAAGISMYAKNDGAMKNTGFELGINSRIIDNRDLKWDLGINIAHYKNKVTELSTDNKITEIAGGYVRTKVGAPIGQFYGYKTNGVYATSEEAASAGLSKLNANGSSVAFGAGDVRFVNVNSSDKIIDEKDMVVIGDPNPDIFGNINTSLQYKSFTLSAVLTYSVGNDIYNALRQDLESMQGYDNQTKAVLNRWTHEGQITNTPRAVWNDPMENSRFSDRWIEDGSYLRMKTVTLSYDFPIKQKFIKTLQAYVTGNNMLTFTKYLGYDPEFSASQNPLYYGIDMGMSPIARSVLFGVKIGL